MTCTLCTIELYVDAIREGDNDKELLAVHVLRYDAAQTGRDGDAYLGEDDIVLYPQTFTI